jgi:putative CocE/NonD family hydrolase
VYTLTDRPSLFSFKILVVSLLLGHSAKTTSAQDRLSIVSNSTTDSAKRINWKADSVFIKLNYRKLEVRIPMRDGIKLYTVIYVPKDTAKKFPILMNRSPYNSAPYGADRFPHRLGPSRLFTRERFIFVYQDVRGRYLSEGDFVPMRPYIPNKITVHDIDESSDAYDTIDWLIKQLPCNNGKVGIWGVSSEGFYATCAAIDAHPALKVVSPQAPVTNWFIGDDRHHNGIFQEQGSFAYLSSFGAVRSKPTIEAAQEFSNYGTPDGYKFYLDMGPLSNFDEKIFHHKNLLWDQMMLHGNYDSYWRARTPEPHLKSIHPAMLTVGGFFDQEDLYGALKMHTSIEKGGHYSKNMLVMGPWAHGGFYRFDGDVDGNIRFGSKTAAYYRENIEFPFFMHYLKDVSIPELPNVYVFETGSNVWKNYNRWPAVEAAKKPLYLHANGLLSFSKPKTSILPFDEYISDPAKPVPYTSEINVIRGSDYMVEDQRFVANRPDVLVYQTEVLDKNITLAGPVFADLFISTTGTDADFIVKIIDVYPDQAPDNSPVPGAKMGGFQMLIRGEGMRAKFRNSFSKPQPLILGKTTEIKWDLEDVNHCFLKGHRIMIQVQSSWFPLNDRNPQQFLNIYNAKNRDFKKATQRIYFTPNAPSHVNVHILND